MKENNYKFELPNANKIFLQGLLLGSLFSIVPLIAYIVIWYIYLF